MQNCIGAEMLNMLVLSIFLAFKCQQLPELVHLGEVLLWYVSRPNMETYIYSVACVHNYAMDDTPNGWKVCREFY